MPERITTSLLSPGCASHRQDGLLLRRHTSPDGIVITDIGSAAGFNSHRPYRPTRLRSIRLQRRPAPHRARPSPCGTSLNPHAFHIEVSPVPDRCSRGEIGEARFRGLISMQNRSLSTFLIVHHKVDREPRAARPPWIGWIGGIADEVTRIVGHGAVRSEAAVSRASSSAGI